MSKRSHHRNAGSFNINELAEALTRNGWQPPSPQNMNNPGGSPMPGMNPPFGNNGGNAQISNNLSALSSLLGAVNNGGIQGMGTPPANTPVPPMAAGGIPQMSPMTPGAMPQMPMNPMMPPSPMAMHPSPMNHTGTAPAQTARPTDLDLLKKLFQEILKLLKET
ncbi:MAG: hypothetical protein ACI3W6_07655 [Clostridia bacterium]